MENRRSLLHSTLVERVAETFGQAYFVYDLQENRFQYLNKAFASLFGITTEDLTESLQFITYVHPEDKEFVYNQYAHLLAGNDQNGIEFRVQLPHQDVKWVCLCCQVVEEEGQKFISGFAEDITKRKEYQANLLKYNSKKNSTLEILSHDLAAPFSNIEGMIELLESELKSNNSNALGLVQFIKENAKKGSDLIRDFVDHEFLESSQIVLHKERIDICERLTYMMENYQTLGENLISKHFILHVPEEPIYMYADVMKLMQVFNNLISNSIKFTHEQGEITVTAEDKINTVLITIADNGIGIPEELQPNIYDQFTSSRREGVKGEKSIGLGMSIIKKIVDLHQGKIWFESAVNEGTTFFVEIPKE